MINALSRSSLSAGSHSRSEPDQTPERTGLTKRKSELVSGLTSIENISLKRLKIFHVCVRSHLQPRHEDILGLAQDGGNCGLRRLQGTITEPDNNIFQNIFIFSYSSYRDEICLNLLSGRISGRIRMVK